MRWTHVVGLAIMASMSAPLLAMYRNRFAKGFGLCEGRLPFELNMVYACVWWRMLDSKRHDIMGRGCWIVVQVVKKESLRREVESPAYPLYSKPSPQTPSHFFRYPIDRLGIPELAN